ncbi:flavin reductase [Aquamicrobium sp. LC103]|nr:flavin reductase [Aquamicrobium sp. LC103]
MLDFAATKGWLDPDGAIRAHIENAEALARQGREALPGVNAQCFKDAMRNLAGGVALVTTGEGNRRSGLTVTAVTSVSAEPPCLLVCVNTSSASHDAILANGAFAVSLLGARHEEVALRFAGVGGIKGAERFLGTDWVPGPTRSPMLTDALCAMDCEVLMHQVVGSHGIFIARVVSTRNGAGEPLVNFQGKLRAFCGN